jgi:hypothetical protein
MLKRSVYFFILGLVVTLPAHSDDLTTAAMELCEKVKSCAMTQVAEEDLTPEVRQMMEPMLDNMCADMRNTMGEVPAGHPLYQPALACMRSMEDLSCEMMQDPQGMETPECKAYEKLAGEASVDP